MEVSPDSKSWRNDLASLVEDSGIRFPGDSVRTAVVEEEEVTTSGERESLKDQIKGFAEAWGEMVVELGRGLRDVVQQTVLTDDFYAGKSIGGPLAEVLEKPRLLNEFLPEDRHPLHVGRCFSSFSFLLLLVYLVSTIKESLLEEFDARVISYDLPGFDRVIRMLPEILILRLWICRNWQILGSRIFEWLLACLGCFKICPR